MTNKFPRGKIKKNTQIFEQEKELHFLINFSYTYSINLEGGIVELRKKIFFLCFYKLHSGNIFLLPSLFTHVCRKGSTDPLLLFTHSSKPLRLQQSLLSSPYIAPSEGHCSTGSSLLINCKLNPSSFEFAISG